MKPTTLYESPRKRSWLWALAKYSFWLAVIAILVIAVRANHVFRDRVPGYKLTRDIDSTRSQAQPRLLRAGFARVKINPDLSDTNRPVYLAGFSQNRTAVSIHDDLWAIACVLDDGWTRLGIVALDAIGFFHDDVARIRRRLAVEWQLDYTVICSTHNHSTPDLMGLWGKNIFQTGVNVDYRLQVMTACLTVLGQAVTNMQPARVAFHEIQVPPQNLVADSRKPEVYDADVRVMHFVNAGDNSTIGTIVGWADHPETVWSNNRQITADYCGYLRDALERGVTVDGKTLAAGVGGIHLYVNGAVGGLMTTSPGVSVRDPYLNEDFKFPSHEKARAVGHQLVSHILPRLTDPNAKFADSMPISIHARTITVSLDNKGYLAASLLGLVDRGHVKWRKLRTEVALLTAGDASIVCVPGEIYPEIVNGGIEKPAGADFQIEPVEVPPLRELMPGRVKFVFGLANDEIGYIIPKSQWDQKSPYTYDAKHAPYGEINSIGPDAAGQIHAALAELCRSVKR